MCSVNVSSPEIKFYRPIEGRSPFFSFRLPVMTDILEVSAGIPGSPGIVWRMAGVEDRHSTGHGYWGGQDSAQDSLDLYYTAVSAIWLG